MTTTPSWNGNRGSGRTYQMYATALKRLYAGESGVICSPSMAASEAAVDWFIQIAPMLIVDRKGKNVTVRPKTDGPTLRFMIIPSHDTHAVLDATVGRVEYGGPQTLSFVDHSVVEQALLRASNRIDELEREKKELETKVAASEGFLATIQSIFEDMNIVCKHGSGGGVEMPLGEVAQLLEHIGNLQRRVELRK